MLLTYISNGENLFKLLLKTIKKLEVDVADFCALTPFPGTPIFDQLDKEGRITTKDWSKYTMKEVVFKPKNMSAEELLDGVKQMYNEFYSNSYTIHRIAKGLSRGLYTFFIILIRNSIAKINSRRLFI